MFHKFSNEGSCGLDSARKGARRNSNTLLDQNVIHETHMYALYTFGGARNRASIQNRDDHCVMWLHVTPMKILISHTRYARNLKNVYTHIYIYLYIFTSGIFFKGLGHELSGEDFNISNYEIRRLLIILYFLNCYVYTLHVLEALGDLVGW